MIEFSVPILYAGFANHGTCATYIRCYNERTNAESRLSFNQIEKVLECCELEENIFIYCYPSDNIVKAEFEGACGSNLELKTTFGYYTFDKVSQDVKN